jgi:hypothetical protein
MLDDVWLWDGSVWEQQSTSPRPPARWGASMTYDPVNETILLYGGVGKDGLLEDTWTWDGAAWTVRSPSQNPGPRAHYGLAFDAGLQQVILFGGQAAPEVIPTDTWSWDGRTWKQLLTFRSPPERMAYGAHMITVPGTDRIVVYNAVTGKTTASDGKFFYSEYSAVWMLLPSNPLYFNTFDSFSIR